MREWFIRHANKSNACLQVADQWSKVEDNSEWVLHEEVLQELIWDPVLHGRKPALDAFASSTTTKVPRPSTPNIYAQEQRGGCNGATMGLERSGRKQAVGVHQWSFPTHGPSCQEN